MRHVKKNYLKVRSISVGNFRGPKNMKLSQVVLGLNEVYFRSPRHAAWREDANVRGRCGRNRSASLSTSSWISARTRSATLDVRAPKANALYRSRGDWQ